MRNEFNLKSKSFVIKKKKYKNILHKLILHVSKLIA